MRMWIGVEPEELCTQHLVGEHGEIHKHRHNFEKRHSITGRIAANCVEPEAMEARHNALETEIRCRAREAGRKPPNSPYKLPNLDYLPEHERTYRIDRAKTRALLYEKCPQCRKRMDLLNDT